MCSGSGNTRGRVLLEDGDEHRGPVERIGDHAPVAIDADGGPELAGDLGDEHPTRQRSLRVERGKPPQCHLVIGIGGADREPKAVIERRWVTLK